MAYAASLANVNKDLKDCALMDTLAVLRLPGVERTAGQRAVGTGPMERINKHDRVHVAKLAILQSPNVFFTVNSMTPMAVIGSSFGTRNSLLSQSLCKLSGRLELKVSRS